MSAGEDIDVMPPLRSQACESSEATRVPFRHTLIGLRATCASARGANAVASATAVPSERTMRLPILSSCKREGRADQFRIGQASMRSGGSQRQVLVAITLTDCVIQDPFFRLSTGRDSRRPDRSASRRFGGNP